MSGCFANRTDRTVWRGGWREIGGYRKYYRSRWEANYARYLEYLRERGEVVSWAHEPTTFWFEGIKRGVTNYLPDFHVTYPGERGEEYHEVKGWMDAKSATKIKRMAKYHPNVKLVVVDKKIYTALEREFSKILQGWELAGDAQPKSPLPDSATPSAKPKTTRKIPKKKLKELEESLEEGSCPISKEEHGEENFEREFEKDSEKETGPKTKEKNPKPPTKRRSRKKKDDEKE